MFKKSEFKMAGSVKKEEGTRTKKAVRKILPVFLACSFCFGLSSTAFASFEDQDTITVNEEGAVETYIGNYTTKQNITSEQEITTPNQLNKADFSPYASYTISNIRKSTWNLFTPVGPYVAYPGTVSVSKGESSTVTASVTGGGGVDIKFLKTNLSKTVGDSVTITATETITYSAAPGTRGRIVLRYSQDEYTYTINKLGINYPGSAFTAAYDEYYALQSVSL
ncbi:hypothetical protein [Paenibacillus tepidiphilus]|uniref:hypothetical protein n=1 Tax=Paenibacillus tepidiphilus TaxID=2608683 RepID=UPI00123A6BB7|nr:hypothetical protein [Paenibacillus tepidiphilus]